MYPELVLAIAKVDHVVRGSLGWSETDSKDILTSCRESYHLPKGQLVNDGGGTGRTTDYRTQLAEEIGESELNVATTGSRFPLLEEEHENQVFLCFGTFHGRLLSFLHDLHRSPIVAATGEAGVSMDESRLSGYPTVYPRAGVAHDRLEAAARCPSRSLNDHGGPVWEVAVSLCSSRVN